MELLWDRMDPGQWAGQVVHVVGGGPSLRDYRECLPVRGYVIGTNLHEPSCDILISQDQAFWKHQGARCLGLDATLVDVVEGQRYLEESLHLDRTTEGWPDATEERPPVRVCRNGASGLAAVHLADVLTAGQGAIHAWGLDCGGPELQGDPYASWLEHMRSVVMPSCRSRLVVHGRGPAARAWMEAA